MTVVREEIRSFRIVPADGQDTDLLQFPALIVYAENSHAVVSGIGTENVFPVSGKPQHTGGAVCGMIAVQRGNSLHRFKYGASRSCGIRIYADILQKEINLVNPNLCVCLGKRSKNILDKCTVNVKTVVLPHLSGTARGAIIKRFPKLKDIKATVENITNVYVNEIVESLKV